MESEEYSEGSNEKDYGAFLYNAFRNHQVRMIISFIGFIAIFLPWFVMPNWGSHVSVNLIDLMLDPNSKLLLSSSLFLFLTGLFIFAMKDESLMVGGGVVTFASFIGYYYWYLSSDLPELSWGLGFYIVSFVGLVIFYTSSKRMLEEINFWD